MTVSDNGWTIDQFGLNWFKNIFELYTKARTKDIHRLLIFDGYNSHFTPTFNQYYTEYKIIPIYILSNSLYLLQSFDISFFSIFRRLYRRQIEQYIKFDVNYIDKSDFFTFYHQVRLKVYIESNICSGFKAIKLVLYDPIRMLLQLYIENKISISSSSSYIN